MAVIISDSSNSSYDGNLSTANGFYRVEAYNAGVYGATVGGYLALTTFRSIDTTFANNCNLQGVVLDIMSSSNYDRTIQVDLEEAKTIGSFNTTTERVNLTAHGLSDGQQIRITTTGTIPTNVTANAIYYVLNRTTDDFQISATVGGAAVNLAGTPTGTATCWVQRATAAYTKNQVYNITRAYSGDTYCPFVFTAPYAVDTTASKWRIGILALTATGSGTPYTRTSNNTAPFYLAWGDNKVTATTTADVLVLKDPINIDTSFTTSAVLGTGDTTYGVGVIICRNQTRTPNLTCYSPASSYTFILKGSALYGNGSFFQAGTSASPIPFAQQFKFQTDAPAAGTSIVYGANTYQIISNSYYYTNKCGIEFYGEVPTLAVTTLSQDEAISQNKIHVTDDPTGIWQVGDRLVIGKANAKGYGDSVVYTISNINGTEITLNTNLGTYARKSGASVLNFERYGIEVKHNVALQVGYFYLGGAVNKLTAKGVLFYNFIYQALGNSSYAGLVDDNAYRSPYLFEDCMVVKDFNLGTGLFQYVTASDLGMTFNRVYTFRSTVYTSIYSYYGIFGGVSFRSGAVETKYCRFVNSYASVLSSAAFNSLCKIHHNSFENGSQGYVYVAGLNYEVHDNLFWGNGSATIGALSFYTTAANAVLYNNIYDMNTNAVVFYQGAVTNSLAYDEQFGVVAANTSDISYNSSSYVDFTFQDCTGLTTIDNTYQADLVPGSKIRFVNYNGTTNDDEVILPEGHYQRTGDGLTDTTAHTSGAGKFGIRLHPEILTDTTKWTQDIPTGDIQNKTMAVACWVKVNNAAYWAATHQMPRLNISYDNGTATAYAEAAQTTDWQQLFVAFSPTTTYGQITVSVDGLTDATSTNAYFYLDDFSVLYPPGTIVNMGGLDYWSKAEPIMPTISTLFSATDVWSVPTSILTGSGTIGKLIVTMYKFILKLLTK